MPKDFETEQLIINELTKTQFNELEEVSDTELYAVDLELTPNKVVVTDADGILATSTLDSAKLSTALQPNDNISLLNNNTGFITQSAITTHNSSTTAHDDIRSIAKGAQQGVAFVNYQTMVNQLNSYAYDKYNVGQSIYVVTREVPDVWVSAKYETSEPYTYTTDEAIVSALKTGTLRIGRFEIAQLETGKVDLSGMVTTDTEQTITGNKNFTGNLQKNGTDVATVDDVTLKGVQVNGTDLTIDANKKVDIPIVKGYGVANAGLIVLRGNGTDTCGLALGTGKDICISGATDSQIDAKTQTYRPIMPARIDRAVKVGLTTNTLTLSDTEQRNAQTWLGTTDMEIEFSDGSESTFSIVGKL